MMKHIVSGFMVLVFSLTAVAQSVTIEERLETFAHLQYLSSFEEIKTAAKKIKSNKELLALVEANFSKPVQDEILKAIDEIGNVPVTSAEFTPSPYGGTMKLLNEKVEFNFKDETLTLKGKPVSIQGKTADEIFRELVPQSKTTSINPISFIIPEAYAIAPLVILAIVVVAAIVTILTKLAISSVNYHRNLACEAKVRIFAELQETEASECELDLVNNKTLKKKKIEAAPGCKDKVKETVGFKFKKAFGDTLSCISDAEADRICKTLRTIEVCEELSKLNVNNSDRSQVKDKSPTKKSSQGSPKASHQ